MIRRANKRAGNSIEINGERKKNRGRLFSEEPRKTLRSETLPVAVLECVLSRDTGLTGKEGWKSVFPSHELHNKPRSFFSSSPYYFFHRVTCMARPLLEQSPGGVVYWLVCKGEGGTLRSVLWAHWLVGAVESGSMWKTKQGDNIPPWGLCVRCAVHGQPADDSRW